MPEARDCADPNRLPLSWDDACEARKREEAKKREEANSLPAFSLGSPTAHAPELSQNEIDALRAQLMGCWVPPVGVAEARNLVVIVHFALNRDGSVSGEPSVVNRGSTALFQIAAESAMRAVRRCQPFRLPASKYRGVAGR